MSDDIIREARDWQKEFDSACGSNRNEMDEDWRFAVANEQWPDDLRMLRETDPEGARPCLVINEIMHHCRQTVNELRLNRPEARVLPVDNGADIETAEMLNGLLRHIQQVSDADIAYDAAAERQVIAGEGFWGIDTQIIDPDRNLQEINIYPIMDPRTVRMDIRNDPSGSDSPRCLITTQMDRHMFLREFPDVPLQSWSGSDKSPWVGEKTITVGRYWVATKRVQPYVMLVNGESVIMLPEKQYEEDRERGDKGYVTLYEYHRNIAQEVRQIQWYQLAGDEVIDSDDWPGAYIPIVRAVGEEYVVDGKRMTYGMVRRAKDPQRMINFAFSGAAEQTSLAPKAPFIGPARAFQGFEQRWNQSNRRNLAWLPYNDVDEQGQPIAPPQRQPMGEIAQGWTNLLQLSQATLSSTTGKFDPSTGQQVDQMSGVALSGWQTRGDIGTYHYIDNFAKAVRLTARIIVDLAPRVYDTPRLARILGEDGEPDEAMMVPGMGVAYMEQDDGQALRKFYDLSVGRYDVRASSGPSFTTRRQEAAGRMAELVSAQPQLMGVIGDLFVRAQDWPMADDIADRLVPPEYRDENSPAQLKAQLQSSLQKIEALEYVVGELEKLADDAEVNRIKAAADVMNAETRRFEAEAKAQDAEARRVIEARDSAAKAALEALRLIETRGRPQTY